MSGNNILEFCKNCKYHRIEIYDIDMVASGCVLLKKWCTTFDINCRYKIIKWQQKDKNSGEKETTFSGD